MCGGALFFRFHVDCNHQSAHPCPLQHFNYISRRHSREKTFFNRKTARNLRKNLFYAFLFVLEMKKQNLKIVPPSTGEIFHMTPHLNGHTRLCGFQISERNSFLLRLVLMARWWFKWCLCFINIRSCSPFDLSKGRKRSFSHSVWAFCSEYQPESHQSSRKQMKN